MKVMRLALRPLHKDHGRYFFNADEMGKEKSIALWTSEPIRDIPESGLASGPSYGVAVMLVTG